MKFFLISALLAVASAQIVPIPFDNAETRALGLSDYYKIYTAISSMHSAVAKTPLAPFMPSATTMAMGAFNAAKTAYTTYEAIENAMDYVKSTMQKAADAAKVPLDAVSGATSQLQSTLSSAFGSASGAAQSATAGIEGLLTQTQTKGLFDNNLFPMPSVSVPTPGLGDYYKMYKTVSAVHSALSKTPIAPFLPSATTMAMGAFNAAKGAYNTYQAIEKAVDYVTSTMEKAAEAAKMPLDAVTSLTSQVQSSMSSTLQSATSGVQSAVSNLPSPSVGNSLTSSN